MGAGEVLRQDDADGASLDAGDLGWGQEEVAFEAYMT